jgi:hypothetical protein
LIDPLLNHLTKTVGGQLLEDVPDFPFTGGNPLPIRGFIHGLQRLIHGVLTSLAQPPLEDFLVHIDLLNNMPLTHHNVVCQKRRPHPKHTGDERLLA